MIFRSLRIVVVAAADVVAGGGGGVTAAALAAAAGGAHCRLEALEQLLLVPARARACRESQSQTGLAHCAYAVLCTARNCLSAY